MAEKTKFENHDGLEILQEKPTYSILDYLSKGADTSLLIVETLLICISFSYCVRTKISIQICHFRRKIGRSAFFFFGLATLLILSMVEISCLNRAHLDSRLLFKTERKICNTFRKDLFEERMHRMLQ